MKKLISILMCIVIIQSVLFPYQVVYAEEVNKSEIKVLTESDFNQNIVSWSQWWSSGIPKTVDGADLIEQHFLDQSQNAYVVDATDYVWRHSGGEWTRDVTMGAYQAIKADTSSYYKFPGVKSSGKEDDYSINRAEDASWGEFKNPRDCGSLLDTEKVFPSIRDFLNSHFTYLGGDTQYSIKVPLPREIAILMEAGVKIIPKVYVVNSKGSETVLAYITDITQVRINDFQKVGIAKANGKDTGQYIFTLSLGFEQHSVDTSKKLLDYTTNGIDDSDKYFHDYLMPVGKFANFNVLLSVYPNAGIATQADLAPYGGLSIIDGQTGKLSTPITVNGTVRDRVGDGTWQSGGAIGLGAAARVMIAYYADVENANVIKVFETEEGYETRHEKTAVDIINVDTENPIYTIENYGDYEAVEWFTSTEPMPDTIAATTPWPQVSVITPKDREGSGTGSVLLKDGDKNVRSIYIRYVKKVAQKPSEGDIKLTESRISKAFKMSEIAEIQSRVATVSVSFGIIHHPELCYDYETGYYDGDGGWVSTGSYHVCGRCGFGRWTDAGYKLVFQNPSVISHVAKANVYANSEGNGLFAIKYSNNTLVGTATGAGYDTTGAVKPDMDMIVFREDQLPTVAKYSYDVDKSKTNGSIVTTELAELGMKSANKPEKLKEASSYNKTLVFSLDMSKAVDGRDLDVSALCSVGTHSKTGTYSADSIGYNIKLLVEKFKDTANVGNAKATALANSSTTINGKTIGHLVSSVVSGSDAEDVKFYPYVEMVYDTLKAKDTKVNVLSDSQSTYKASDYVEYGWVNAKADDSLIVSSTQWSTHTKATNGTAAWKQKNRVLPGGAIFSIGHNTTAKTTVGLTSWQTYLEDELRTAVGVDLTNASKYVLADKVAQHTTVVESLKKELEKTGLQMWANTNFSASPYSGQKVGSGVTFNGKKLQTDNKYWFQKDSSGTSAKNTEGDLDVLAGSEKTQKTYYRMRADVDGMVYLEKQTGAKPSTAAWVTLQSWAKTVVTPVLSGEVKELDDRTKLVTNFFNALDRNGGSDSGAWYSESFRGICVIKSETTFDLGFEKPAERKAVLDPHLEPPRKSTSDYFSTAYVIGICTEEKKIEVSFGTIGVKSKTILKDIESVYRSKAFYIPNVSVTDSQN